MARGVTKSHSRTFLQNYLVAMEALRSNHDEMISIHRYQKEIKIVKDIQGSIFVSYIIVLHKCAISAYDVVSEKLLFQNCPSRFRLAFSFKLAYYIKHYVCILNRSTFGNKQ